MRLMKNILIIGTILIFSFHVHAESEIVTECYALDEGVESFSPLKVKRLVRGGTIFDVTYGEGCDYEVQGAFNYACKIVEEQIESCMPITVKVEFKKLRGSAASLNKLSNVTMRGIDAEGPFRQEFTFFPKIKWTLVKEQECSGMASYVDEIKDYSVLRDKDNPDISIVYNEDFKDDFSYTIANDSTAITDKYDFVSLAIRDLVRGLGFRCDYRKTPGENSLQGLSGRYKNAFEYRIDEALASEDPYERYVNATRGTLDLSGGISLYAPATWEQGVSLNDFVDSGNGSYASILRHDFARGTVNRNFDNSVQSIEGFFGYRPHITTGAGNNDSEFRGDNTHSFSLDGDNTEFLNYLSTIEPQSTRISGNGAAGLSMSALSDAADLPITNPMLYNCYMPGGGYGDAGTTISFLKKDGTWDVVYTVPGADLYSAFELPEYWRLHFEKDEYARTPDGFLRGRATKMNTSYMPYPSKHFTILYFVLDYFPQTVNLEVAETPVAVEGRAVSNTRNLRLKFKNTEGLTRLVVEKLIEGRRLPVKTAIADFKKGYYETTVKNSDKVTYTLVGYNSNGSSRSNSVAIEALTAAESQSISFRLTGNSIELASDEVVDYDLPYTIVPLGAVCPRTVSGTAHDATPIDISALPGGMYVLNVYDSAGQRHEFKFRK